MSRQERRNSMTLDEVSLYWLNLRRDNALANHNKLCNSISTIDLAFEGSVSALSRHLSRENWARIRSDLFDVLLTSFPGTYWVYSLDGQEPLELKTDWPHAGQIEFHAQQSNRKTDILRSGIETIHPTIVLSLRWAWAEGRNSITVDDFESFQEACVKGSSEEAQIAGEFLDRLCEICVSEAEKSRKIAHRAWWRLSSEVSNCSDKQTKNQIKRKMSELETIWGYPA